MLSNRPEYYSRRISEIMEFHIISGGGVSIVMELMEL